MNEQSESSKKYDLEKEHLIIERLKLEDSRRFSSKYFGIIVTAAVTLVVAIISGSQVWMSEINKSEALERQALINVAQLEQTTLEQERRYKLDIGKFVIEQRTIIFAEGNDDEKVQMREILLVIFPPEITAKLFAQLKRSTQYDKGPGSDTALLWSKGQDKANYQITAHIEGLLASTTNRDISEVIPDSELVDTILKDDTLRENFFRAIQKSYKIKLSKEEIKELNTPDKISNYITAQ